MPVDKAGDWLFVLLSPEVAMMFTHELGWTWDEYEAFLEDVLTRTLTE